MSNKTIEVNEIKISEKETRTLIRTHLTCKAAASGIAKDMPETFDAPIRSLEKKGLVKTFRRLGDAKMTEAGEAVVLEMFSIGIKPGKVKAFFSYDLSGLPRVAVASKKGAGNA